MNAQRTWEGMLAAPLVVDNIVLGELVWAATKSLISSAIILLVAAVFGVVQGWEAVAVVPILFLIGLCFGAMALLVSILSPSYDFFLYYFTLIVTPMFLFSGVFFPVTSLPAGAQWLVWGLPLSHAITLVRPLMTGQPASAIWPHFAVLGLYVLLFFYLTVVFARRKMIK
jgi:lipooligosaccharide transport system permease protein